MSFFSFSIMLINNKNVKEIPAFSIASFISDSPYQAVYGLSNPVQFSCCLLYTSRCV